MSGSSVLARPDAALDDRYRQETGPAVMSGIQALVRVILDQRRLDRRRGLDTGAFVSGYQGSPLGGLDQELARRNDDLDAAGVVFRPGLNEELAATAVAGTQLLGELPGRRRDGVTGWWYGKNPGFDRAADAVRHGNLSGTAPLGGAVALIGDDPSAKSSTVPSSCEPMCRSLLVPLLAPGTVQDVLALGLHAVAMSRYAGCWTGMKIVADIADASSTVELGVAARGVPELPVREAAAPPVMLPPSNVAAEHDLMAHRLERARRYAGLAELNRIVFEPRRPRVAVVAAGVAHQAVVRALGELGLDAGAREEAGLRVVCLGMPWPLDVHEVRRLCAGVETVVVLEDKLPFVEALIKDALYRTADAPLVLGSHDAEGLPLLAPRDAISADRVARLFGRVLDPDVLPERARARVTMLEHEAARDAGAAPAPVAKRTPYFCSGCPHNTSTRSGADDLVGVGIGCHTMVALDDGGRRGTLVGMPQMGGEGAQWLGLAPFTHDPHFVQNLGDGTFHHSGSLAIRAAIAAGARITYRLLYNDAVAMTGGQRAEGRMSVPEIVALLHAEGVARMVVTTPEPERYRGVELAAGTTVRHRDQIEAVQAELAAVDGVTVLIHDDRCATEKRRLRKRGELPQPAERVWINERVCEGCGDCGEQSSCLSVQPKDTEFGRKTTIHQASCNSDMSCLKGDCPSFVMVRPAQAAPRGVAPAGPPALPVELVDPPAAGHADRGVGAVIRMPGIGGTGVVTVSALLQMAAHLDGLYAAGLEQTGLAQKGGPVISDVRLGAEPVTGQIRAGAASVDLLVGLDVLGAAAPATLATLDPGCTVAVVNTHAVPTAHMVVDPGAPPVGVKRAVAAIEERTARVIAFDGGALCERLFGDHMPANVLMLGAAFQAGGVPVSAEAIERAIELNGTAVETNLAAFRWGRARVIDPEATEHAVGLAAAPEAPEEDSAEEDPIALRVRELERYQSARYARRFRADVDAVAAVEAERTGAPGPVTEAYARGLHKLMAYKDEYEVARLHLDAAQRAARESEFGPGARVHILLHPPLLRALGLKRKIPIGRWGMPLLGALAHGRRLRGTPFDPFGHTRMRRTERALVGEYRELVREALDHLEPATAGQVAAIAELPDLVRGYEDIKLAGIDRFRAAARSSLDTLAATHVRAGMVELPMVVRQVDPRAPRAA